MDGLQLQLVVLVLCSLCEICEFSDENHFSIFLPPFIQNAVIAALSSKSWDVETATELLLSNWSQVWGSKNPSSQCQLLHHCLLLHRKQTPHPPWQSEPSFITSLFATKSTPVALHLPICTAPRCLPSLYSHLPNMCISVLSPPTLKKWKKKSTHASSLPCPLNTLFFPPTNFLKVVKARTAAVIRWIFQGKM